MLECKGVVRNIGKAPEGAQWVIKFAKGIPFVTDTKGLVKKWCMAVFQAQPRGSEADALRAPMQIDINKVTEDSDHSDTETPKPSKPADNAAPAPAAPKDAGDVIQTPAGTPRVGVKSLAPGLTRWPWDVMRNV